MAEADIAEFAKRGKCLRKRHLRKPDVIESMLEPLSLTNLKSQISRDTRERRLKVEP